MNQFEWESVNINSTANSNVAMDITENAERYNSRITEEENENSNPIPLLFIEEPFESESISLDYLGEDNILSSIVDDINEIYKEYPFYFESLIDLSMNVENLEYSVSQNTQSTSGVNNTIQNDNIDEVMVVDSNDENITALGTTETVPLVTLTSNQQQIRTVNINDGEHNIIVISDDEDENSVQLNGEQNNIIILSDDEDDNSRSLETSQPVPCIQLTRQHELRSARNIKKILPRFKRKVQENLQFLCSKRQDFIVSCSNGYKLLAVDIVKLITPRAWLTDGIILHYCSLLVQHSKQVLLLDPDMLKSCIQKGFVPEWYQEKLNKTYEYNKIIIPINPNRNHWALVVLEIQEGKMNIIDSMANTSCEELKLVDEFVNLAFKMIIPNGFKSVRLYSPAQLNTDDCGVFTCTNARYFIYNKVPDYQQRDIPLLRHRIAWELINKTLIPF